MMLRHGYQRCLPSSTFTGQSAASKASSSRAFTAMRRARASRYRTSVSCSLSYASANIPPNPKLEMLARKVGKARCSGK
jgi:hypothetical protein